MTQTKRIYDYMVAHGGITAMEAMTDLGITRLSARIWDLKREGVQITKERKKGSNRYGETCYYDRYKVVEDAGEFRDHM